MQCPQCRHDLPDGAPVYRYRAPRQGGEVTIQCADCAAAMVARLNRSWEELGLDWGRWQWRPPAPCEGCGRPVIDREAGGYVVLLHVTCGDPACRRAIRAATARSRRRVERRDCPGCGTTFKPARDDARYCSPACRQHAYRQRLTATAPATPP